MSLITSYVLYFAIILNGTTSILTSESPIIKRWLIFLETNGVYDINIFLFYRMVPYGCLATGQELGLIEIVPNSQTIMAIQSHGGRAAAIQIKSSQLHNWIKFHNIERYLILNVLIPRSGFIIISKLIKY